MQNWNQLKTTAQSEALINELKGNLFEFLVGLEMARMGKCRDQFFREFGGSYKEQLNRYETWLRKNQPHLTSQLPHLAKECALKLSQYIGTKIDRVVVLGKLAGASHNSTFKEGDVILLSGDQLIPVSLKLCKQGAFVNTKSAGIFSFLTKYFSSFYGEVTEILQARLNQRVYSSFHQMGGELYDLAELDFHGRFDSQWINAGHSELPGQLPKEYQAVVLRHYQRVIKELYRAFTIFLEKPSLLQQALAPIIGFGEKDLIQLTCFHQGTDNYRLEDVELLKGGDMEEIFQSLDIGTPPHDMASFEIRLHQRILQIRVKPMNKFTVTGLKVNCSVKKAVHG